MTSRVSSGLANSCVEPSSSEPTECRVEPPVCREGDEPPVPKSNTAPAVPWGLRFCREADTVIEGFLCDEPVVVSDACRKPKNAFDAYVCDEPRMHALQKRVLRETFELLKALVLELFRP